MMNSEVINKEKSENGTIYYHILGLDDWDYFDTLVDFFIKQYGASIENKTDGIHTRVWQLFANNEYFMLEHNEDIGNYFYSYNKNGDSQLMRTIASDLETKLKNISYE